MRIKIYKSDKPQEDYTLTGVMAIIESDEGIPLAFFRQLSSKNYLLADLRDKDFPTILNHLGITYHLNVVEKVVKDKEEKGKVLKVENGKIIND